MPTASAISLKSFTILCSLIPYTRITTSSKNYSKRISEGVVFAVVDDERDAATHLEQREDLARQSGCRRTDLDGVARREARRRREQLGRPQHLLHVLRRTQRLLQRAALFVVLHDSLLPLQVVRVLELVDGQCVVEFVCEQEARVGDHPLDLLGVLLLLLLGERGHFLHLLLHIAVVVVLHRRVPAHAEVLVFVVELVRALHVVRHEHVQFLHQQLLDQLLLLLLHQVTTALDHAHLYVTQIATKLR